MLCVAGQQCLSLDRRSDRSTSPLSPVKAGGGGFGGGPETKILPLSSFREPENRRLYTNMKLAMNEPASGGLHPYFGDKVHPSSLKRNHYMNQPPSVNLPPPASSTNTTSTHGGGGGGGGSGSRVGSNKSLPHHHHHQRGPSGSGRQVTFAQSRSLPRFEAGGRSPCPPAYEHLLPDGAGNYTSFSRGIDDDDGNTTTTSGSYTLDNIDMDDSIS